MSDVNGAGVAERRKAGAFYNKLPQREGQMHSKIMSHPFGRVLLRISFQFPARLDSVAAG